MPNKSPTQINFYRSKEEIPIDFYIFFTNVVLSW